MSDEKGWGKRRPPCARLWETPMVHVDGALTTCCLDTDILNALGNLRDQDLNSLWNGPKITAWRKAQIYGDFEASGPYCTQCNWRSAGAYPMDKSLAYLEGMGEGASSFSSASSGSSSSPSEGDGDLAAFLRERG